LTQAIEIGAAAALRVQPTSRAQRFVQVAEQRSVVQHPVERRGAEDSVEAVAERKSDQVSSNEPDSLAKFWLKILPRVQHHVAGKIESDDAAARKIPQKEPGEFAGAATGVEDALVSAQVKFADHALAPLELRRGKAVVFGGVPFARIWRRGHPSSNASTSGKLILKDNC